MEEATTMHTHARVERPARRRRSLGTGNTRGKCAKLLRRIPGFLLSGVISWALNRMLDLGVDDVVEIVRYLLSYVRDLT
jgi:hypothetical protein